MIKNFKEALDYLYSYIREVPNPFVAGEGLKRTAHLLELLGNPQETYKVIHIAGTSGKGSTAFYTSRLLHAMGFKVGLQVSPHLVDIRERFQINNAFIDDVKFVKYLNDIIPSIEKMKTSPFGSPTYFELVIVLSYYIFYKENVDYAVAETGLGGWYDATNTVNNPDKLAVLTAIGLDHIDILGNTPEKIALQKAKIIKKKNMVISHWNTPPVREVIEEQVKNEHASLTYVEKNKTYSKVREAPNGIQFNYSFGEQKLDHLQVATHALYQAENISIALTALFLLAKRDKFTPDAKKIREVLMQPSFPGRMEELVVKGRKVILDGAHNPQKMEAFLRSLLKTYHGGKFHFLTAFKEKKDFNTMIQLIIRHARSVTATSFSLGTPDGFHRSEKPEVLLKKFDELSYGLACAVDEPKEAFDGLVKNTSKEDIIVVTGSLYLLSCLWKHIHSLR